MQRYGLFVLFLLLWGISVTSGILWGGFGSWFLVGCIGFLLSYTLLQHVLTLGKMTADVRISVDHTIAGEAVEVHVTVKQTGVRLPVPWLTIRDIWSDSQGRDAYRCTRLLFPGFSRSVDYRYSINQIDRGIYGQHRIELVSGDKFGLLKRVRTLKSPSMLQIIALPRPVPSPDFFGMSAHSMKRIAQSKHWNQTSRSSSVRDYQAGDPMRLIHWKATARTGEWKTVETEVERCSHVVVYLDTSGYRDEWIGNGTDSGRGNGTDNGRGSGTDSGRGNEADSGAMFEAAVQVAAGLLTQAAKRGARLRLAVTGGGHGRRSRELGPGSLQSLLVELAGLHADDGSVRDLPALLRSEISELRAGTAVLCVTAAPDEALAVYCAQLARGQRSVSVYHVLPPAGHDRAERPGEGWRSRFASVGCGYAAVTAAASTAREVRRDDASA